MSDWITVTNVAIAKAKFHMAPAALKKRMLDATRETAQEIAQAAQTRILRSPSVLTRALYNAIAWTVSRASGFGRVGVARTTTAVSSLALRKTVRVRGTVVSRITNGRSVQEVVQPSRYAHLVERGTVHSPAEPFMTPSAEEATPRHLQRCREAGRNLERDLS